MRGWRTRTLWWAALLVGCRGGKIDLAETCDDWQASDAARARTTDSLTGQPLLPSGRVLQPAGRQVVPGQLGYAVDVVAHPLLPIAYVADVRYGGWSRSDR